jgi:hypothetical protein
MKPSNTKTGWATCRSVSPAWPSAAALLAGLAAQIAGRPADIAPLDRSISPSTAITSGRLSRSEMPFGLYEIRAPSIGNSQLQKSISAEGWVPSGFHR